MDIVAPALRSTFSFDAAVSGIAGFATLLLANWLAPLLDLGDATTQAIGVFMLVYAAALATLARWRGEDRRWGRTVALGNALWVLASVWLAFTPILEPSPWGRVLVLGQAAAIALLACAQWRAAARATTP